MTFSSRPRQHRTILKDWEDKCIAATKQHGGVHKDTLHQPQNANSLRHTRDNTAHMVFEGEKLHVTNIDLGQAQMETLDKTKSPLGEFTVLDILTTKAIVLLGFSFMNQ